MKAFPLPAYLLALLLALAIAAPSPAAAADAPTYAWVDDAGALHTTPTLSQVPEPFYGVYRARLNAVAPAQRAPTPAAKADAAAAGQPATAPTAAGAAAAEGSPGAEAKPVGGTAGQVQDRERWRAQAVAARNALVDAVIAWQAAEAGRAEAARNPLLNFTPVTRAKVAEAGAGIAAAREKALAARQRLLVELPAQARRAGVPPQWLMP